MLASPDIDFETTAAAGAATGLSLYRFGQTVWRELRGVDAGLDTPQISIHRGRLHTVLLDAVRLGPGDDACAVTAAQIREVAGRLAAAGHWQPGDPPVLVVLDAGYNPVRLARLLAGVPAEVVARVRSSRVFHRPAPPKEYGMPGRQARHGAPVRCDDPATWQGAVPAEAVHPRYGPLLVLSWGRVHQRLDRHCGGWEDWPPGQELPAGVT